MTDTLDILRYQRLVEINAEPNSREALAAIDGRVWDTAELAAEFEVLGFMAPFVVVRRRVDGQKGNLEFQHSPRFYFNFVVDEP
jgi:hypothetical protein